jgi:nitrogen fixation protein
LRAAGFGDGKIAAKNGAVDLLEELPADTLFSAMITAQKLENLEG